MVLIPAVLRYYMDTSTLCCIGVSDDFVSGSLVDGFNSLCGDVDFSAVAVQRYVLAKA